MFFRQLQYLVALAKEEHFSRAAERCNVSQPSLSSAIKQLEFTLGVPIVLRGRRFLGFTEEGLRVIDWAERVIAQRDAMLVELSGMRENYEGRMRLGAMPNSSPVLPLLSHLLAQTHPGVEVDIRFLGIEETKLGLSNYALDVGITYLDHDGLGRLKTLPIYIERLSLLVPDNEQFRDRSSITWKEAAELPLAMLSPATHERQYVDQAFAEVGCRPAPRIESESIVHLMFHAQFGELMTIIPGHFTRMPGLHPGTKALDLVDPVVSQEVGLVWTAGEPMIDRKSVV
jgi:DNA-binding transcriptional LysR family regulator